MKRKVHCRTGSAQTMPLRPYNQIVCTYSSVLSVASFCIQKYRVSCITQLFTCSDRLFPFSDLTKQQCIKGLE
jgi:hypothetical protein